MSHNNNYQQIQEIASSIPLSTKDLLRTQQKDIVCGDCGGISAAKVQQLLSTLEGTTQLFHTTPLTKNIVSNPTKSNNIHRKKTNQSITINKKRNSARNNSQKPSLRRNMKKNKNNSKRNKYSTKQQKLNFNKIRSSLSSRNNNKIRSKSKKYNTIKIKKLSAKNK